MRGLMNAIGKVNKARTEFRANTLDHVAGATYDAIKYGGKQLAVLGVAMLFTLLNKWQ